MNKLKKIRFLEIIIIVAIIAILFLLGKQLVKHQYRRVIVINTNEHSQIEINWDVSTSYNQQSLIDSEL